MRYKGPKEKAWQLIRRICFARSEDCYTCGQKNLEGQNKQAGHFIPVALMGSNNRNSWDTRFIRTQCGRCNGAGQGEQVRFRERLIFEYGEAVVANFEANRHMTNPIKNWHELVDNLQTELGNMLSLPYEHLDTIDSPR